MTDPNQPIAEATLVAFCAEAGDVTLAEAKSWIARGWLDVRVGAGRRAPPADFTARLVLIREIRRDLGVEEGSLDLVLDLIDRLKLETRKLDCLNAALEESPEADAADVRARAARIFRERL